MTWHVPGLQPKTKWNRGQATWILIKEWFQTVTERETCEINVLMFIIGCRRVVMGYRTVLFTGLWDLKRITDWWSWICTEKQSNWVQCKSLLICGTWGSICDICSNDLPYCCGGCCTGCSWCSGDSSNFFPSFSIPLELWDETSAVILNMTKKGSQCYQVVCTSENLSLDISLISIPCKTGWAQVKDVIKMVSNISTTKYACENNVAVFKQLSYYL